MVVWYRIGQEIGVVPAASGAEGDDEATARRIMLALEEKDWTEVHNYVTRTLELVFLSKMAFY